MKGTRAVSGTPGPLAYPRVSLGVSGTSIGYQYRVGKAMGRQWEGNRQWEGEGQRGVFNYNKINNYSIKVVMMSIAGLILIKF